MKVKQQSKKTQKPNLELIFSFSGGGEHDWPVPNAIISDSKGNWYLGRTKDGDNIMGEPTEATLKQVLEWYCKCEAFQSGSHGAFAPVIEQCIRELGPRSIEPPTVLGHPFKDAWNHLDFELYRAAGKICALDLIVREIPVEEVDEEHWSAITDIAFELSKIIPKLRGCCDALEIAPLQKAA